jgi:aldehyde oxidoreductase
VRVVPTTVGGGFGSKLDLSLHPYMALAAWRTKRPVGMVYSRPESMMSTTKRHPSRITSKDRRDPDGRLVGMDFEGVFNTGAYASWGPTVANRVPVHASGPYVVGALSGARSLAVHTHCAPAGAFRGFGVPQAAVAQETLIDELADAVGMDRLEFRLLNAIDNGMATVTGQVFAQGVGIRRCLEALKSRTGTRRARAPPPSMPPARQAPRRRRRRHVVRLRQHLAAQPLDHQGGAQADGSLVLFQGAVDIGQGSNTVIAQICADALGLPVRIRSRWWAPIPT